MKSKSMTDEFLTILPAVLYQYVLYNDGSGELLYMSPSAKDILGHPSDYFVKDLRRFWKMVHPDDLVRLRHEDVEANNRNELFVSEIRIRLPCGQERWVQLSSKPTSEMKRNAVIWIGYLVDITRIKRIEMELLDANRKLKALSRTDGLTGLANRRYFDKSLKDEWERYKRFKKPFALILIDVDFFKKYNDQYGHQRGDDCLKSVTSILKKTARRALDLPARYGGEEFIIIAVNTTLPNARNMAEQIRQGVESLNLENNNTLYGQITVSIGVSAIEKDEYETPEALLNDADKALYRAKNEQRNCVRIAYNQFV